MKNKIESVPLSRARSDVVVVGVFQGEPVGALLGQLDRTMEKGEDGFASKLAQAAENEGFLGQAGQTVSLPTYAQMSCKRLVLVGLGKHPEFTPAGSRKLAANMARRLGSNNGTSTVCFVCRLEPHADLALEPKTAGKKMKTAAKSVATKEKISPQAMKMHVQALIEGWRLGSYSFEKYKSANKEKKKRAAIDLSISLPKQSQATKELASALVAGETIASATNLARALIAEPASFMTPTRLGEEAKRIAKETGLTVKVMDAAQVEKLGMGAFLGVARGAAEPARFIVLKYDAVKPKKTVGIVGKGITFDSGGLSLKPAAGMEHMKYDMSGAAVVLATMQVVGTLKPKVSVLGVIAATENMPGAAALHPGDVLTAMNGKTIEVNNTDAEGRLVLADALSYAVKQGVDELIDIATLTGAVVTALGRVAAGVMGTDQTLIDSLIKAGSDAGEKLWQLPLYDEYKDTLKSDIADLKNAGARGEAPTSSAAMFLREFVEGKPWAHLDIAGPGWLEKERDENNKGGTAFGVRTICHYILGL